MQFDNVYGDERRARSYAELQFPGTYYLASRDLCDIIHAHVKGQRALDFACGTGRSTRFLGSLGFATVGVDIAASMQREARARDLQGDYRLIADDGTIPLQDAPFDLVLSAFTFDNIPTREKKVALFHALGHLLDSHGILVNLVSSPDIYTHEWASFTTRDFPENRRAKSGDRVKIVMTDVKDRRPVEDILWADAAYRDVYEEAGLALAATHRPLVTGSEPYAWVNETRIAPWVIYVLRRWA